MPYSAMPTFRNPLLKILDPPLNPHNLGDIQLLEYLQKRQLDGSVGVAGVHLPALGPFLRMIVAPNFTFLLSSQDEISFWSVSSMTYITSKHLLHLIVTVHLIP